MPKRYELTEAQWRKIEDLLPGKPGDRGRTAQDNRAFVNGVLWVLRSGALVSSPRTLRQLEERSQALHALGESRRLGRDLRGFGLGPEQRVPHDRHHHREGSPAGGLRKRGDQNKALGRSRGGLSTKIHMLADAVGRPLRFVVTGGQVNDCTQADRLLENVETEYVIADKGYDTYGVLENIHDLGAVAVVPPRSNRKARREYDKELYKERNLIERTFNKLKRYRRLALPATTAKPSTSAPSCTWPLLCCGCNLYVDSP